MTNRKQLRCFILWILLSFIFGNKSVKIDRKNRTIISSEENLGEICEKKTGVLLSALINKEPIPSEYEYITKFVFYSGWLDNYGDYKGCNNLNSSDYNLLLITLPTGGSSSSPFNMTLVNGICYFKECNTTYMLNALSNLKGLLAKNVNASISSMINSTFSIVSPKENNQKIKEDYITGFVVCMIITGLLIAIQVYVGVVKFINRPIETNDHLVKDYRGSFSNKKETDALNNKERKKGMMLSHFLACFDFVENAKKVLNTHKKTNVMKALAVLDGVRVLSICYVILGHIFYMGMLAISNFFDLPAFFKTWKFPVLTGGFFAVDVFFFMSGFLFYLGLQKYFKKDMSKMRRLKLVVFSFVNRYIRLLPIYLFAIFILTYLMPILWGGPNSMTPEMYDELMMSCTKNFWKNLLYINNFTNGLGCVGVAWYLSNDMQFFIISILIFIPFNRNKFMRNLICLALFLSSIICSFVISFTKNFGYNDFSHTRKEEGNFMNDFYIMPYIRITTYMLGLYFAELFLYSPVYLKEHHELFKENVIQTQHNQVDSVAFDDTEKGINTVHISLEDSKIDPKSEITGSILYKINQKLIESDLLANLLSVICIIGINYAVFIVYVINNNEVPIGVQSLFHCINKLIFVGSLGLLLHLTYLGRLQWLHSLLSFRLFTPLARITFGVFLIHMSLQMLFYFTLGTKVYFEFWSLAFLASGFAVISYFFSFFVSLIFESPMINILKRYMGGASE